MSILIKGMVIPERCGDCPFEYKNYCMAKPSLMVESTDRHPRCPLVTVPPHGRLIDADALCKVLQKNSEDEWNNKTTPFSWAYAYRCVKDTVENIYTIIEAEEGET